MTDRDAARRSCDSSGSSCRRGRSATPAPGSRCSRSPVCRATRSRRSPTRPRCTVHRRRAERRAAHPVGQGRRLRRTGQAAAGDPASRSARSTPTSSRTTTTCSAASPTRIRRSAQGAGPPARVRRHHGPDRVARPEALVLRRHQLPRAGQHPRPAGPARRGAGSGVRAAGRRPAADPGVQALRAGVLHDGRPGLGHVLRALPGARRGAAGLRRHRAPRAGHEHRVHRRVPAAGGEARRVRLQLAVLRRRRPDGRRRRPVPAVPDPVRGQRRRRVRRRHARSPSCSTSATTSSPRSPARSGR